MTLTIELSQELEAKLETAARRSGLSKDELARCVLEERFLSESVNGNTAIPAPRVLATNLPVKDRSREDEWLRAHQGEYAGQYVALEGARLIAHGNSFKEVATAARAAGVSDALVVFVESPEAPPYLGF